MSPSSSMHHSWDWWLRRGSRQGLPEDEQAVALSRQGAGEDHGAPQQTHVSHSFSSALHLFHVRQCALLPLPPMWRCKKTIVNNLNRHQNQELPVFPFSQEQGQSYHQVRTYCCSVSSRPQNSQLRARLQLSFFFFLTSSQCVFTVCFLLFYNATTKTTCWVSLVWRGHSCRLSRADLGPMQGHTVVV